MRGRDSSTLAPQQKVYIGSKEVTSGSFWGVCTAEVTKKKKQTQRKSEELSK